MKHTKLYDFRLAKYFNERFDEYEDECEWFGNPAPNQWLFDIPSLGQKIELTCDDNGKVSEIRYPIL